MEVKITKEGSLVSKKYLAGIDKVDRMVGGTLGPAGRNRIIQRKYRSPLVTNDGVTIARHIVLEDEIEDLAAQTLVEIAMKTNETAGDGTTTSTVIAAALIRSCVAKIEKAGTLEAYGGASANPMLLAKEIWKELPKAIALLEEQKIDKEIIGDALDMVIATSLENLDYGKTLGELMRAVGQDGYVSIEDNWGTKYGIDTEQTIGMRFLGTYASPYLANEHNTKEAIWEDTLVFITNERIANPATLALLYKEMVAQKANKLVIIGGFSEGTDPFSPELIEGLARVMQASQANPNLIKVLAVKAPTLRSEELEDIAVFTDAKFYDKKLGFDPAKAQVVHCGFAKKIVVTEDDVFIMGGRGSTVERVELLKKQMEKERDTMFLEKTKRRIASLSSGVGIIRVGAATEQERTYLKYKLEDAVHAAKAAMEEGVVPGGGIALQRVAEKLGEEHILYDALVAPHKRICENAGEEIVVPDTVVDPHKVVRLALANACSAAAALISSDGAIADRRMTVLDYFEKKLGKLNPASDDFRDDENQDQGRGRL